MVFPSHMVKILFYEVVCCCEHALNMMNNSFSCAPNNVFISKYYIKYFIIVEPEILLYRPEYGEMLIGPEFPAQKDTLGNPIPNSLKY